MVIRKRKENESALREERMQICLYRPSTLSRLSRSSMCVYSCTHEEVYARKYVQTEAMDFAGRLVLHPVQLPPYRIVQRFERILMFTLNMTLEFRVTYPRNLVEIDLFGHLLEEVGGLHQSVRAYVRRS